MKNILTYIFLLSTLCLFTNELSAQANDAFKYQAVARNADGEIIQNGEIALRFSILESGVEEVYREVHNPVETNASGVFSVQLGYGNVVGGTAANLAEITWNTADFSVRVELDNDLSDGVDYQEMGIAPLLSVPYAMHARTVSNADDADADPTNELQKLDYDAENKEISISDGNFINLSSLIEEVGTDDQTISLEGTTLSIENGNTVNLAEIQDGVTDPDADPANEIQFLSFNETTNELEISEGNKISLPLETVENLDNDPQNEIQDLFIDPETGLLHATSSDAPGISVAGGPDGDADPENELQTLNYNAANYTLSLSDGGQVDLSNLKDADSGMTGTDDQVLGFDGNVLSIEDGNTVDLSSLRDGTIDADADATNEIQVLSQTAETIELSNGGGFVFVDTDASNELQVLSTEEHMLSLSNGGGTVLVDTNPENELQNFFLNEYNQLEVSAPGHDVVQLIDLNGLAGGSSFWSLADEAGIIYDQDIFVGDEYANAVHVSPDAIHFHSDNPLQDAIFDKQSLSIYDGNQNSTTGANGLSTYGEFFGSPLESHFHHGQMRYHMNGFDRMSITPVNLLFFGSGDNPGITAHLNGQTYGLFELFQQDGSKSISMYADFESSGRGRIITDELEISGGSDLAEFFDVKPIEAISPTAGMVVSIDPDHPGKLTLSTHAYDTKVAGIISGANGVKVGMHMGQKGSIADGAYPVALTGRVYVYADASNGAIQAGDMLTSSDKAGYAMKATDTEKRMGSTIGKAMTSLTEGEGFVLVLVNLQ